MSSRVGAGRLDRGTRLKRLHADRELLARAHPYLEYRLDQRDLTGFARGAVPLLLPDGQIDPIEIAIHFGPAYPSRPPTVRDAGPRWIPDNDRHIPSDHSFCLYLRDVDQPDLTWPAALKVFMLDIVCFLEQQLIYDRIGRFAGPQWPHTRAAYALYIVEQLASEPAAIAERLWDAIRGAPPARNDPCPCAAGNKYKRCHLDLITHLARIATRYDLRDHSYTHLRRFADEAA